MRLKMHLNKLRSKIDHIKNKSSKRAKRRFKRYNKAYFRINEKIKNLIKELHNKSINFLVSNYNEIIIPDTNISNIVLKKQRNIGKETVKNMLSFSHYTFRTRLMMKSNIIKGLKVNILGEEYTSKTCGRCGTLNDSLGSKKEFKCDSCGLKIDRDANGARNIMIKFFTELKRAV